MVSRNRVYQITVGVTGQRALEAPTSDLDLPRAAAAMGFVDFAAAPVIGTDSWPPHASKWLAERRSRWPMSAGFFRLLCPFGRAFGA